VRRRLGKSDVKFPGLTWELHLRLPSWSLAEGGGIPRELEMRKSFVDAEVVLELLGPGASTCRFVTGPGTKGVRMVWTGSAWQGEVF